MGILSNKENLKIPQLNFHTSLFSTAKIPMDSLDRFRKVSSHKSKMISTINIKKTEV